jgi:hypothetical protein
MPVKDFTIEMITRANPNAHTSFPLAMATTDDIFFLILSMRTNDLSVMTRD